MAIDWSLLQTPNVGGMLQAGIQQGREQRRQVESENALAAYAQNPGDPNAENALVAYMPQLGLRVRDQRIAQERTTQIGQIAQQAAGGDKAAQQQLWGLDPEMASRFDGVQRKKMDEEMGAIGQAAYRISLLPPDQRPQAWDSAVEGLSQRFPEMAQYRGRYSEQSLNAVLDQTGMSKGVVEARQPKYTSVPQGGYLEDVNPYSRGGSPVATGPASATSVAPATPASGAIDFLRQNPNLAAEFDQKYGAGSAARVLGGPAPGAPATFP
ncbi:MULTISPECIES: hypothetical protein [unclassified Sphingomonas]|uniref:hypothetical protein n=1 Tax=unclassified Sphingomonas TaxID=196159 RepID=UPI0006F21F5F|nr:MULTISPECIES: hypothetical protein [unclassified Sphingomonas]KQM58795.1 hypothetical protein ASE65_10550 [Sphingomonas sp. Leaf16]KQN11050.1 hypothetical protein ASE81_11535 [Sphingomonas sp. Leaf29]KQN18351.1 hypothetical protein ASE83_11470 [Sphingomonas sp. Leaf32]